MRIFVGMIAIAALTSGVRADAINVTSHSGGISGYASTRAGSASFSHSEPGLGGLTPPFAFGLSDNQFAPTSDTGETAEAGASLTGGVDPTGIHTTGAILGTTNGNITPQNTGLQNIQVHSFFDVFFDISTPTNYNWSYTTSTLYHPNGGTVNPNGTDFFAGITMTVQLVDPSDNVIPQGTGVLAIGNGYHLQAEASFPLTSVYFEGLYATWDANLSVVPLPTASLMGGAGLITLAAFGRRRYVGDKTPA